jgi:hypothetical protein
MMAQREHLIIYPEIVVNDAIYPTYATAFRWYKQYHESNGDLVDNMFILGKRLKHMQKPNRPIETKNVFRSSSVLRKIGARVRENKRYDVVAVGCYGNGNSGLPDLGFSQNASGKHFLSYNKPLSVFINNLNNVLFDDSKLIFYVPNFASSPRKYGQKRTYTIYESPAYVVFQGLKTLGRNNIELYAHPRNNNLQHYLHDPFWVKIFGDGAYRAVVPVANKHSKDPERTLWRNWKNKLKNDKDTLKFRFFDMPQEEVLRECLT